MIDRNWFGRTINIKMANGKRKKYSIDNISQRACTLEDGTSSFLIACGSYLDPKVAVYLHPDDLTAIFTGVDDTHTVDEIAIIDQPVQPKEEIIPHVPSPKNGKLKGPGIKPIKETKKQRALEIFGRMYINDGSKRAIIQAFEDQLSMNEKGATTYYYNCKKDLI